MTVLSQFFRLIRIYFILIRFGLDSIILDTPWFHSIRFLKFFNPWFLCYRRLSKGQRIRLALEKLGPFYIKFGQILSTRRDLLPDEIADELAKLQDQVPPFAGKKAIAMIEQAFGQPLDSLYKDFDSNALASASVAQVHTAKLHDGTDVVVKVLRPNILKKINRDIALLKTFARFVERCWSQGYRLKPTAIVKEFEDNLHNELDLMREAANASQLRRNFDNSHLLYVPEVYFDYCRGNVMTMERIYGMAVDDVETLKENHVDMQLLSERGVEIFFTQVFRDNFFHADMHPGNIFVSKEHPENPMYLGVDFGIMGSLSDEDKRYLAENFLAFFNRDYRRVAQLHIESHWVPSGTRIDQFEGAIRSVCEPIFQRPLKDISYGQLLVRLFKIAGQFHMPVQPQLVLLQKTLLNVEGLGRQLNPDLDLWATAKPFLENWTKSQVGPRAFMKRMREQAPYWFEKLPEIPALLFDHLQQQKQAATPQPIKPNKSPRRFFLFGVSASLVFAALYMFILRVQSFVISSSIFIGLGAIFLLFALLVRE